MNTLTMPTTWTPKATLAGVGLGQLALLNNGGAMRDWKDQQNSLMQRILFDS